MTEMTKFQLRLPVEELEGWRRLAALRGVSVSGLVRGLVAAELEGSVPGVAGLPVVCEEVHRRGWKCRVCGWFEL